MEHNDKNHATGTFAIKDWDEKTWDGKEWKEVSGAKLTYAKVTAHFQGDIEGEASMQAVMAYTESGAAHFTGLQLMVGRVGERSGTFVLQVSGAYAAEAAKTTWFVVPDSGTGDLRGLRGEGGYVAVHGQQQVPYTLDYDFDKA
jgi:hypothetical protein